MIKPLYLKDFTSFVRHVNTFMAPRFRYIKSNKKIYTEETRQRLLNKYTELCKNYSKEEYFEKQQEATLEKVLTILGPGKREFLYEYLDFVPSTSKFAKEFNRHTPRRKSWSYVPTYALSRSDAEAIILVNQN